MSRVIVMKMGQFGELWKVFDCVTPNTMIINDSTKKSSAKNLTLESTDLSLCRAVDRSGENPGLLQLLLDGDSVEKVHKGNKIGTELKSRILSSSVGQDVLTMDDPSTTTTTTEEMQTHENATPSLMSDATPTSTGDDEDPIYLLNVIKEEAAASTTFQENDILYSLNNSSIMTILQNNEMEIVDSGGGVGNGNNDGNSSTNKSTGGNSSPTTSNGEVDIFSRRSTPLTPAAPPATSPGSPDRHHCSSTSEPTMFSNDHIKDEDGPRRMCLVCGDVASGFHYGVSSCEACKAFFKRTIQGNIEYTCPASSDCEINKRRRKACQACRFQKCLRMGMLKEGVRLDRVRGGRQKYRRMIESNPYFQTSTRKMTLEDNKLLQALSKCEPEAILAMPDPTAPNDVVRTITTLSDFYDRELVGTIGWAKQIPGFTELSLNDQIRLLQSSWSEILTLTLIFRSLPRSGKLKLAADFTLNESQARDCGLSQFYFLTMGLLERAEKIGLRKEEYLLLKAIIISNCDVRVEENSALWKLRENLLASLHDCTVVLRSGNPNINVQNLLLLLPGIRQADAIIRQFWDKVREEGKITLNKLLIEMLNANSNNALCLP